MVEGCVRGVAEVSPDPHHPNGTSTLTFLAWLVFFFPPVLAGVGFAGLAVSKSSSALEGSGAGSPPWGFIWKSFGSILRLEARRPLPIETAPPLLSLLPLLVVVPSVKVLRTLASGLKVVGRLG